MDRALHLLHIAWGGKDIEKGKDESPLTKMPSLQNAVAEFKRRVRFATRVSVDEAGEWHLATCTHVTNRLAPLAISTRQAAIKGMPEIDEEDSKYITRALLTMRGVNQKIHKIAHDAGSLELCPKPISFKGTSHAWVRNLKKKDQLQDWTVEPALPDGQRLTKQPLSFILCPAAFHGTNVVCIFIRSF